jgi:hypothetical protein
MAAVGGFPSLSQLLTWPTEHLTQAAEYWETIGGRCYELANQVWQDALSIDWQGVAADTLRSATYADMMTTSAVADQLQSAAKVARSAASDLQTARSRVRYAVEDARTAGFDVRESLSVTDRSSGGSAVQRAARQVQAQTLAADIGQRAAQLVALDQQVAGKITEAVAGIGQTFPPSPAPNAPPTNGRVHAVDHHTFKQDPPSPPPPGNPFAGWTDAQKAQVATEIANGHALEHFPGTPPADLARLIYDAINDPNTRIGTSTESGGLALLKSDGTVIFINPQDGDYGTAFVPKPTATTPWRTPLEYFEQNTRAVEPLAPPPPGRFPPPTPGEMAPRPAAPLEPPPAAPKPAPLPKGGEGSMMPGGPGTPIGPTLAPPPHYHGPHVLGDPVEDPWDFDHHAE